MSTSAPNSAGSAEHGEDQHDHEDSHRGDGRSRTFSANLDENVYQCFKASCGSKGDVIDLWASVKGLSLRDAALDLVRTFGLEGVPQ